ncbi:hypothetical protein [Pilimelia terevasa]|uniref:hypothetical protein n=1 Tax=Pilimelia terevasa TaxID=53372 RepID=UPI001669DE80|nr:hypothetical protein [Pilimelia terevasa]
MGANDRSIDDVKELISEWSRKLARLLVVLAKLTAFGIDALLNATLEARKLVEYLPVHWHARAALGLPEFEGSVNYESAPVVSAKVMKQLPLIREDTKRERDEFWLFFNLLFGAIVLLAGAAIYFRDDLAVWNILHWPKHGSLLERSETWAASGASAIGLGGPIVFATSLLGAAVFVALVLKYLIIATHQSWRFYRKATERQVSPLVRDAINEHVNETHPHDLLVVWVCCTNW